MSEMTPEDEEFEPLPFEDGHEEDADDDDAA